jgi:hypothetical protein
MTIDLFTLHVLQHLEVFPYPTIENTQKRAFKMLEHLNSLFA